MKYFIKQVELNLYLVDFRKEGQEYYWNWEVRPGYAQIFGPTEAKLAVDIIQQKFPDNNCTILSEDDLDIMEIIE